MEIHVYEANSTRLVVERLARRKIASGTEMQSVVLQWLGQLPTSFFASGIRKLGDRWDKVFKGNQTIC